MESSRTSLASRTSSRTHFEVLGLGLGLEHSCPWPWPRIFFVSLALASSLVSSTPPLLITTGTVSPEGRYRCKSKSNFSLYSLYHAEACNEFAVSISASLRPDNTATFEERSQRWRAVGNSVFDLTGPRFKPTTSGFRDERVTARPPGRLPAVAKIVSVVCK